MNKEPRGAMILLLLGILNQAESDITKHPFLKQAHKRAKRAEAKLSESPSEISAARRSEQEALRRMNNFARSLDVSESRLRNFQNANAELQQALNTAEEDLQAAVDEIGRLKAGYDLLVNLREASEQGYKAALQLRELGFKLTLKEE